MVIGFKNIQFGQYKISKGKQKKENNYCVSTWVRKKNPESNRK